jgi:hypothetical protein
MTLFLKSFLHFIIFWEALVNRYVRFLSVFRDLPVSATDSNKVQWNLRFYLLDSWEFISSIDILSQLIAFHIKIRPSGTSNPYQ